MLPGRNCPTSYCFTSASESWMRGVPGAVTYLPPTPRAISGFNPRSWEPTTAPSRVTPISSSSVLTPIESAPAKDTSVFSGNSARPPRWASISNAGILISFPPACSAPSACPVTIAATVRAANWPRIDRRFLPRTILPDAEGRCAEQRLLRGRLRAPILRRRKDLAAELGCGVPGPARIVKHAAGERDHIGLAGSDDFLGVACFRDQSDGHRGHVGGLLDRFRERQLVAGRQRDLLMRRH